MIDRTFAEDGHGPDPLSQLAAQVAAARDEQQTKADTPVTIADVAAAAFVALETLVALLPDSGKPKVIAAFEERAAQYAASMEEGT